MKKIGEVIKNDSPKNENQTVCKIFNLRSLWRRATTEHSANVTTPKVTSDKVLHILVHDGIWYTELNYLQDDIVQRLKGVGLDVKSIKFKNTPALQKYEAPKFKPYPVGEREVFYIEKCSEVIDNTQVKESFEKAMKAYFKVYGFENFING